MAATFEFHDEIGDSRWLARSPIAGTVCHQSLGTKHFDHIGRPLRRTLRDGIESHPCPKASIQNFLNGVLFDVIDQDSRRFDPGITGQHIEDHASALILVFKVRRMNENLLMVTNSQIDMFEKDRCFVARIFIETDFADPEHVRFVEKFWDHRDDFAREADVFSFFGVNTKPGVVLNAERCGSFGFEVGELSKIVAKAFDAAAIKASPKSRLAHRDAPHSGKRLVVIGGP